MKKFLDEDFLLTNDVAKELYFNHAKKMPIYDFHCHLVPQEIYEDKKFKNITEAWLGANHYGDHYKWRLLREFGVEEKYITGDADDRERFNNLLKLFHIWSETQSINGPISNFKDISESTIYYLQKLLIRFGTNVTLSSRL